MSRLVLLAWLAELASCASSAPAVDLAKIETLEYAVPAGWKQRDVSSPFEKAHEWKPDGENERKESLVVSRVARPALAKSRPHLRRTIVEANNQLPRARFSPPTSFVTRGGLPGLRVEGTFTPPNQAVAYHRIHAVLVDEASLVHVLYTARELDREHIEAVLDGLRPGA
jgi:hypothetical protein